MNFDVGEIEHFLHSYFNWLTTLAKKLTCIPFRVTRYIKKQFLTKHENLSKKI
jgi:hypothetical protein